MANLVPVDHDPFAAAPPAAGGPRLVPVDHDPFAQGPATAESMGFASRDQREGGNMQEAGYLADAVRTRLQQDKASPMGRLDAYVRGVASWVPGMNKLAAAGDAAVGSGQGSDFSARYTDNLMRQRAMDTADQALNPGSRFAGQVGGFGATAALLPAINAVKAPGIIAGAANGALTGALYSGAERAIEKDGSWGDKAQAGAEGALTGAVVGAPLGAAAGALVRPAAGPVGNVPGDIAAAAERIGVAVPKAIATDSVALQRAAQGARNVPFAGDPLVKATDTMVQGLGRAADDVTAGLGSGDRAQAGATASGAIKDWIVGKSAQVVDKAYGDVDRVVDPAVRSPLSSTQQTIANIAARRQNANIQGDSKAIAEVLPAAQNPQGLNYSGIKDLRTRIGEFQKSGVLPADMSGAELKQIYGALSDDLRAAAANAGGQRGLQLFERANRLNAAVATRREELAKIIGKNGDAPAEQVFDTLVRFAGEKGGADIGRLAKARNAIGGDWDEVMSGVVSRLGRDAEGNFTPDRFVTAWGNLSQAGKSVMFSNSAHRAALEDIAMISSKSKDLYKKFGNPSGTAQNLSGGALVAGLFAEPVSTLSAVLGGNVVSRVLSQPATASSMARWSRVYSAAVTKPSAATAATLQVATRNLAATIGEQLGVKVSPQEIIRALSGPRVAPASDGQLQQEE